MRWLWIVMCAWVHCRAAQHVTHGTGCIALCAESNPTITRPASTRNASYIGNRTRGVAIDTFNKLQRREIAYVLVRGREAKARIGSLGVRFMLMTPTQTLPEALFLRNSLLPRKSIVEGWLISTRLDRLQIKSAAQS
ncbi:hypothetical protein CC79DRAFT_855063 [Sarocladium strictum]